MSLQKPLSPIYSSNGSGVEDEDETLYALNSRKDDSQIQESEEDDINDLSYLDDYSTTTTNSYTIVRRNSNGRAYPSIPSKLSNINPEIPVFVLQKVLMQLSYNEVFLILNLSIVFS